MTHLYLKKYWCLVINHKQNIYAICSSSYSWSIIISYHEYLCIYFQDLYFVVRVREKHSGLILGPRDRSSLGRKKKKLFALLGMKMFNRRRQQDSVLQHAGCLLCPYTKSWVQTLNRMRSLVERSNQGWIFINNVLLFWASPRFFCQINRRLSKLGHGHSDTERRT